MRTGRARSAEEAAALRGVPVRALIKTLVVRRRAGDHVLVLVPGDRAIDWPKLRAVLGERRLSLPDADEAQNVTGYERGTITPFGCRRPLPVVADAAVADLDVLSIGGGAHGVSVTMDAGAALSWLEATVADVTRSAD